MQMPTCRRISAISAGRAQKINLSLINDGLWRHSLKGGSSRYHAADCYPSGKPTLWIGCKLQAQHAAPLRAPIGFPAWPNAGFCRFLHTRRVGERGRDAPGRGLWRFPRIPRRPTPFPDRLCRFSRAQIRLRHGVRSALRHLTQPCQTRSRRCASAAAFIHMVWGVGMSVDRSICSHSEDFIGSRETLARALCEGAGGQEDAVPSSRQAGNPPS